MYVKKFILAIPHLFLNEPVLALMLIGKGLAILSIKRMY